MYLQRRCFLDVPEMQMKVKLAAAPRDADRAPLQRPRGGMPCLTAATQGAAAKPCFPPYAA